MHSSHFRRSIVVDLYFILFYSPFPNISHTLQNQWARYWVESGLVLQSECEDCLALTQLLASHALEVLP